MVEIAGCAERWNRVGFRSPQDWATASGSLRRVAAVITTPQTRWEWLEEPCALAPQWADATSRERVGIRIGSSTLVVLDRDDQLVKTKPFAGSTLQAVSAFARSRGVDVDEAADADPIIEVAADTLDDVERWISNGHSTLSHIVRVTRGASAVSVDGESLSVVTHVALPSRKDEAVRSVRVGFSLVGEDADAGGEVWVQSTPAEGDQVKTRMTLAEIAAARDGDGQARSVEVFLRRGLESAYGALQREWRPRESQSPSA